MEKKQFDFQDEFVQERMGLLKAVEIERFVISNDSIEQILEILEADKSTVEELRAKRNSVVKLIGDEMKKIEEEKGREGFDEIMELNTKISGVTAAIDREMIQKGADV